MTVTAAAGTRWPPLQPCPLPPPPPPPSHGLLQGKQEANPSPLAASHARPGPSPSWPHFKIFLKMGTLGSDPTEPFLALTLCH